MDYIKFLFATIIGFIATITRQYALILAFVIIAITLDVITGIIKAKITDTAITSKSGTAGFWKKMSLLASLFFGCFLDYFIPFLISRVVNIDLPVSTPFGLIVGSYIVLNESISICENIYACNPGIMPKWIVKVLKLATSKIDNSGGND